MVLKFIFWVVKQSSLKIKYPPKRYLLEVNMALERRRPVSSRYSLIPWRDGTGQVSDWSSPRSPKRSRDYELRITKFAEECCTDDRVHKTKVYFWIGREIGSTYFGSVTHAMGSLYCLGSPQTRGKRSNWGQGGSHLFPLQPHLLILLFSDRNNGRLAHADCKHQETEFYINSFSLHAKGVFCV